MSRLIWSFALLCCIVQTEDILLSINCGGEEYIDSTGLTFVKVGFIQDQHYIGGYNYTHPYTSYIRYTDDPFLYIYSRASDTRISYTLPLPGDGSYVIILHFLETEDKGRVFDVSLGDLPIIRGIETVELIGLSAALEVFIPFNLTKTGQFFYNGTQFTNPGLKPKQVALHLDPNPGNDVQISAIQLVRGGIDSARAHKQQENIRQYMKVKYSWARTTPTVPASVDKEELTEQITGLTVLCRYPFTILLGGVLVFLVLTKAKG